ncbi:MAG: heavy metal translocating P-type ATPase metal-binding domain-containing protein [Flammeovirgaceae bacterium]|nr:heavy metal translocating P-type ATPase metal-binding domain-containing protein [Flammeovirgaceae bacterium]
MINTPAEKAVQVTCAHCGEPCEDDIWYLEDKPFCCYGCKTVYEILDDNNLCEYYALDDTPGVQLKNKTNENYVYVDEPEIRKKLLEFDSETFAKVKFQVPNIHCISCIWLLENLQKLNVGILRAEVSFASKQVTIHFNPQKIQLSNVAGILSSVGYAPYISLEPTQEKNTFNNKSLIIKLAVAPRKFRIMGTAL